MSGLISTWMGDRLGIPAAVDILHGIRIKPAYYCACNKNKKVVLNLEIMCPFFVYGHTTLKPPDLV